MDERNARQIVDLAKACRTRVCTTSYHHGCPYGDESLIDCIDRLMDDYAITIENLLRLEENLISNDVAPIVRCKDCKHSIKYLEQLGCESGPCAESFVRDDFWCKHGERGVNNA